MEKVSLEELPPKSHASTQKKINRQTLRPESNRLL